MSHSFDNTFRQHYSLILEHIKHLDECISKLARFDARIPELRKMKSRAIKVAQDAKRADRLLCADNDEVPFFDVSDQWNSSDDERRAHTPLARTTPPPLLAKRTYEEYDEIRGEMPQAKRQRLGLCTEQSAATIGIPARRDYTLHDIPEEMPTKDEESVPHTRDQENVTHQARAVRYNEGEEPPWSRRKEDTHCPVRIHDKPDSHNPNQTKKRKLADGLQDVSLNELGQKRLRSSIPV